VSAVATTVTLDGDVTGWPSGASGRPFMAILDRGVLGKMEKVLCSGRTGQVVTISSRGYDGTAAIVHDVGVTIEHGLGAGVLDDLSAHVYDITRDDHTQYARTDGSRPFTDLAGLAGSPVAIGAANADGNSQLLARANHVHRIPDSGITNALIAADAVTAAKIAAGAVGNSEIAAGSIVNGHIVDGEVTWNKIAGDTIRGINIGPGEIGQSEMGAGLLPLVVCTSATRPTPINGMTIYETDTGRVYRYSSAAWVFVWHAGREDKPPGFSVAITGNQDSPAAVGTWPTTLTTTVYVPPWAKYAHCRAWIGQAFAVTAQCTTLLNIRLGALNAQQVAVFWDPVTVTNNSASDINMEGVVDCSSVAGTNQVLRTVAQRTGGASGALRVQNGCTGLVSAEFTVA
jgi:hypothetical protein